MKDPKIKFIITWGNMSTQIASSKTEALKLASELLQSHIKVTISKL